MSDDRIALDVGRLLALALQVSRTPRPGDEGDEYSRLVARYRDDPAFRATFDGVLEGARCNVESADPHVGLVIRTKEDGPWAWPAKAAELPWNRSFDRSDQRSLRALVVVGLLAFVTPAAADLDDLLSDPAKALPDVGVRELERFIREFAKRAELQSAATEDPEKRKPIWWHWLRLPEDAPTPRGKRQGTGTTTYVVHEVLSFLHRLGWLVETSGGGGSVADRRYRPRRRLLHHYRDLLLNELFTALRSSGSPNPSTQTR